MSLQEVNAVVIVRDLAFSARKGTARTVRLWTACSGVAAVLWLLYGDYVRASHTVGGTLFRLIALAALLCSAIFSVVWHSDGISGERRAGTLMLIRLTELTAAELVVGKWAAGLMLQLQGLLAVAPFLILGAIFGGVRAMEVCRELCALVVIGGAFISISLFFSTIIADPRLTQLIAALCLAALLAFGFWGDALPARMAHWVTLLPTAAYELSFWDAYERRPADWSASIIFGIVWNLSLLAAATALLPSKQTPMTSGPARRKMRSSKCEGNPGFWLACWRAPGTGLLWAALISIGGFAGIVVVLAKVRYTGDFAVLCGVVALTGLVKLWAAAQAAFWLAQDREEGVWELIRTTPLPSADIVSGQYRAIFRGLLPPAIFAILVASGLAFQWGDPLYIPSSAFSAIIAAGLVLDVATLGPVGVWTGLTCRRAWHSTLLTVWRVLFRPLVIWAGLMVWTGVSHRSTTELLLIWFVIGTINNLVAWTAAEEGLSSGNCFAAQ